MGNNALIISDFGINFAIDPAGTADFWRTRDLDFAVATHGHFDHISGLNGLGVPWFVWLYDIEVLEWSKKIANLSNMIPPASVFRAFPASIANQIQIIKTPGHSPGSVCFYFPNKKILATGDTLFADSIGNTDLPLGDAGKLQKSLRLLTDYGFSDDVLVVPGHGQTGRWGEIKKVNPFVKE